MLGAGGALGPVKVPVLWEAQCHHLMHTIEHALQQWE